MTVSTVVDHNDYTGNGVTTSFPYTFRIFKKADLVVSVVDIDENITVLVLDTDYTVTNAGGYNGGNVVLTTPLTNGWQISIARELEPTQETDLRNQGKFFAEVHEDAFDKLTMLIQQAYSVFRLALRKPSSIANWYDALNNYIRNLRDPRDPQDAATKNYVDTLACSNLSRTLRVPEPIPQLPDAATRANKMPAFDSAGNPIVVLPPSGSASDVLIELAKPTGVQKIGTNHRGTLQQDLDVIDIRTSGQSFDTLLTTPKDVEIDTALTVSTKTIGTAAIKGRPKGSVTVAKDTTKQIRGLDFTEKGVVLDSVSISGSNVLPGDNWATFCTYVEASSGKTTYINSEFKDATAAVNCEGSNTVFAFNRVSGMMEHPSTDAGGYGFLTGAVTDALIIGNSADAAGGDPASPLRSRHFAYISDFAGDSTRINTGVRIIGNYADWRRVSQAQFSAPTIKGRGQNGLIIANNQLRGGNVPVHVTADSTDVLRVTVTGNQFLNYEKNVTNHPCVGVWLYAAPARDYIREFIISNNVYAATRSVATDFARTVNGVWLQKTTQGVISDSTIRLPGLAVPVSMEDTSRVIVSNIEDFTGDANPSPFFAFAGACSDITVSNILTNRAIYGADINNVTDLTVDYQRKLIVLCTNGTITNNDPHLLMQSVSVTGTGEITVVFKSYVTTKALDAIVAKGNRIAGPHVFVNRTGKSLVCTIYSSSGTLVPLSSSTVGIDFIFGS